ncbi:MAG: hypothetical protein LC808_02885 [Actinobacteria bacterium]|nr:hypothetical protein [Actinomycetota bacterium]
MRLGILEHGHRLPAKAFQRIAALLFRDEMDDVIKTAMHRPEFFGRPLLDLVNEVLRGPSYWTAGEREYMAVFTSRLNECPFCVRVHTETTRIESDGEVDVDANSFVRPQLAAVLPLLESVSRTPDSVTPHGRGGGAIRGVPDDAIADALHVNLIFNIVNRLANAFDWAWDSDAHVRTGAKAIHRFRYKLPRLCHALSPDPSRGAQPVDGRPRGSVGSGGPTWQRGTVRELRNA